MFLCVSKKINEFEQTVKSIAAPPLPMPVNSPQINQLPSSAKILPALSTHNKLVFSGVCASKTLPEKWEITTNHFHLEYYFVGALQA
jgi:hypothetical protein